MLPLVVRMAIPVSLYLRSVASCRTRRLCCRQHRALSVRRVAADGAGKVALSTSLHHGDWSTRISRPGAAAREACRALAVQPAVAGPVEEYLSDDDKRHDPINSLQRRRRNACGRVERREMPPPPPPTETSGVLRHASFKAELRRRSGNGARARKPLAPSARFSHSDFPTVAIASLSRRRASIALDQARVACQMRTHRLDHSQLPGEKRRRMKRLLEPSAYCTGKPRRTVRNKNYAGATWSSTAKSPKGHSSRLRLGNGPTTYEPRLRPSWRTDHRTAGRRGTSRRASASRRRSATSV